MCLFAVLVVLGKRVLHLRQCQLYIPPHLRRHIRAQVARDGSTTCACQRVTRKQASKRSASDSGAGVRWSHTGDAPPAPRASSLLAVVAPDREGGDSLGFATPGFQRSGKLVLHRSLASHVALHA